jgi:hypothetical protein
MAFIYIFTEDYSSTLCDTVHYGVLLEVRVRRILANR